MKPDIYGIIFVMALVTYLIRMLPMTLVRREIKSKTVRSFLHYVPYVTLAAMIFPSILTATKHPLAGMLALLASIGLAYQGASLVQVALAASVLVYVAERLLI